MRKTLVLLFTFFLIFSVEKAFAQENESHEFARKPSIETRYVNQVVKFNPLALMLGKFSFAYERLLNSENHDLSVELEASYTAISLNLKDQYFSVNGFRLSPQFRYYAPFPWVDAPLGLFGAVFGEYSKYDANITVQESGYQYTGKMGIAFVGGGVHLGYQWIVMRHFTVEFYTGCGYQKAMPDDKINYSQIAPAAPTKDPSDFLPDNFKSGLSPNLGFKAGFAF